jgi:hypothetical protein
VAELIARESKVSVGPFAGKAEAAKTRGCLDALKESKLYGSRRKNKVDAKCLKLPK